MVQLILSRITPDNVDETDCGGQTDSMKRLWLTKYEGELYLRILYLTLKEQNMVNDCNISDYIGSRQQCLYGCMCFMLLFFSMYDSVNLMKVKNIDWFQGTIIKGSCSLIRNHSSIPINHEKVLRELGGIDKTIPECIFDLVNTANPSGGLIGPGNNLCFHNLMLKLSSGPTHKKLIKNHVCVHDACGF